MNDDQAASVTEIIEEVKEEMCDHYCKWPDQYKHVGSYGMILQKYCDRCPLNRL